MSAPIAADVLRSRRMAALVSARWQCYATGNAKAAASLRGAYERLAQRLPHWLRHNGLARTLQYLEFLGAGGDNGRDDAAARDLLEDWRNDMRTRPGLHLAQLREIPSPRHDPAGYRHASRLALVEAQWLKRAAEHVQPPAAGSVAMAGQGAGMQFQASELHHGLSSAGTHPGLVWRFGGTKLEQKSFRAEQVNDACTSGAHFKDQGSFYQQAFCRREQWLSQRAVTRRLKLASSAFTALGDAGIFEAQSDLHPVTGLPRLAASGLKGLLRSWLHGRRQQPGAAGSDAVPEAAFVWLFGSEGTPVRGERAVEPGHAGALQLHDAWWVPGTGVAPLVHEVDTPHHPGYHAGKSPAPSDTDSPQPNPQLACTGEFLFAIDHSEVGMEWASACLSWLLVALQEEGAGARRRLGYGLFQAPGAQEGR